MFVLTLGGTAVAQIEPGAPGSIEYMVITNNETWVLTMDPIDIGTYVQDMLPDRLNQPDGRGAIGIVTGTGFDPDYNEMAATVDFGRDYSSGIVFSELSAIEIVPTPEPSAALMVVPGLVMWRALRNRRQRAKATS